jgi:hypothetical protein
MVSPTLEPTKRPNGSEHVGRHGPLFATSFHPPALSALLQKEIEQAPFGSVSEQAAAKFGEHGKIKSRIGQFQAIG